VVSLGVEIADLRASYHGREVLHGITLDMPANGIFGIIGPAGSAKTTMLTCLNRTIELTPKATWTGKIVVAGEDVRATDGLIANALLKAAPGSPGAARVARWFEPDPVALRRRVAMVLPLPVGLPMSIYDNVAFAPRMAGLRDKRSLDALVERCLTQAALWDEVKDRLAELGTKLSGGQQQRLTLARALSTEPDVLCLDEFSIAIDPVTTMRIESVLVDLKATMTIVMVTNLLAQARRVADRTAFLLNGELVEEGPTDALFDSPKDSRTADYISGKFG
jgi:phosphate transport system ATP-binding protein